VGVYQSPSPHLVGDGALAPITYHLTNTSPARDKLIEMIPLTPDTKLIQQFTRIAEAKLRSQYKFGPQRRALAAKMCRRWLERQKEKILPQ